MLIRQSRQVQLASYPQGLPTDANFCIVSVDVPAPATGQVQVRNIWMSVDPYMRGQMRGADTYVPGFKIGEPLVGGAVGVVAASESPLFHAGDVVLSHLGWREAFNAQAAQLTKVDATKLAPEVYLGAAGLSGLSAYVGMLHVAKVKAGDVVFVSGAAGAVGSIACQIAKLKGAFVVGSAGGPEKCEFLRQIGVNALIDYRSVADFAAALGKLAPDGIDVFFDNVGGEQFDAAVRTAKPQARFALCGRISTYNDPVPAQANTDAGRCKQIAIEHFLVTQYFHLMPSFLSDVTTWIQSGSVISRETVEVGLDRAVTAFLMLFSGRNIGKMLVRLEG